MKIALVCQIGWSRCNCLLPTMFFKAFAVEEKKQTVNNEEFCAVVLLMIFIISEAGLLSSWRLWV